MTKNVTVCFLIAEKNSSGKDEVADYLLEFLRKDNMSFDVLSFATPVIQAYMGVYDEHRFDFYKKHPHKRDHLLEFSTFAKRDDTHLFVRKSANFINKIIDSVENIHFILIPDCRYFFEMLFLKEHCNITNFICININRDIEGVKSFADREPQYEVPTYHTFTTKMGGKWIDLDNDRELKDLKLKSFKIYRSNIL